MTFYTEANFYPESSLGYLVKTCQQHAAAALDRLFAVEGVSTMQWSALISIYFGRGVTCATLARDLAHDKGAMTRMIDALEERGLVARARDEADRRVVNLSLTAEGEAMAMRCRTHAIACWNEVLVDWDEAEVTQLIAQLTRLRASLEATTCAA